ncbi:unnamed protein product [Schistosoma rodhaini]|nr:unnamed protein product [Schistosoma rodhaini]
MNATKCEEDITSDHKISNITISQNNTNDNTRTICKPAIQTTKTTTTLPRKLNADNDDNNTNSFLSLYTRCIKNPNRRKKKQLDNNNNTNSNHNHQSHFCLNFCRNCSSNTPSSSSSSSSSSTATTEAGASVAVAATTGRKESNSFSLPFPLDNKSHDSLISYSSKITNNTNFTNDISSPGTKVTLTPNHTNNIIMSVSNCSNQFNSISVDPNKKDNHKIDAQNTSVHINKRQTADKFHSNTTEYQSKSNMTTTVMTSIPTTTTIEPINVHKKINPSLMIADNSAYFNDNHENLLEISKLPIYDSTKLCIKCQKNIQLVSKDYEHILLLTNNQGKHEKITVNNNSIINNNNNGNGYMEHTTEMIDDIKSKKIKEMESDIEEYVKHVQHIFDHINLTKDQFCQTDSKSNYIIDNKQLWDAFNTSYANQEKIFRPSHNDINIYHLDDDMNNGDVNDDNDEEIIEAHYDNVHSYRKCNHFSVDKMDKKRISKIYRQLHNLRCQVESFSYLSWLGLTAEQPPTQKVLVPGFNAPAPNPQMHLIRRSDADSRRNIQEFKLLCKEPVSKEDLIELRSSTFNNWSRTDAQLIRLVREMFQELGFIEHYNIQLHQLDLWLTDIYRRYNRVPFHNYKHAFMVTQMCYVLIWGGNLTNLLDIDDQLILIVSAICHDLDHPGFNNAYQINAGTVLAMRYNDQSPLENHHTAVAFDLLSHKEVDPFSHLSTTTRQRIRKGVIRCILATDMSRHNEILDEFNRQVLTDLNAAWEIDPNTKKPTWVMNKTQKDLVMVIILKISDISNEARPLNVAGPWINRLLAEFFHQSDYEKLVGLPVAPFMDRHKVTKSASQCGFIRFVILPLFESLAKLLPEVKPIIVQPALEQLAYYTDLHNNEEKKTNTENQKSNTNEHQNGNNNNHNEKEHSK